MGLKGHLTGYPTNYLTLGQDFGIILFLAKCTLAWELNFGAFDHFGAYLGIAWNKYRLEVGAHKKSYVAPLVGYLMQKTGIGYLWYWLRKWGWRAFIPGFQKLPSCDKSQKSDAITGDEGGKRGWVWNGVCPAIQQTIQLWAETLGSWVFLGKRDWGLELNFGVWDNVLLVHTLATSGKLGFIYVDL